MWTLSGILFSLTFPWGKGNRIMRSCSLADAFSQVPLYLRQTVITVTAISKDQTSAYTIRQQITLFSKVNPDVLVHESSHAQVILPPMLVPVSAAVQRLIPGRHCVAQTVR